MNSGRKSSLSLYKYFAIAAGICLLALGHAARDLSRFLTPSLWAEEGAYFLSGIMTGQTPLINAGYLNVFTYGILAGISAFSYQNLPVLSSAVAVGVAVLSYAYFLLPQWQRFVEFKYRLAFVIFFLGFSPFYEGIGVLEYSFWNFGVGTALLILEILFLPEYAQKLKFLKCLYLAIGALSGPAVFQTSLAILGAHGIQQWLKLGFATAIGQKFALIKRPLVTTLVVCGLIQASVILSHASDQHSPKLAQWIQFPQATLFQFHMRILLPTFLSHSVVGKINDSEMLANVSLLVTGFVLLSLFLQKPGPKRELVWLLTLAAVFSTWIMYLGRGGMFDHFRFHPWNTELDGLRYSYLPGVFLISGVFLAFTNLRSVRLQKIYLWVLVPMTVVSGCINFNTVFKFGDVQWAETARQLVDFRERRRDTVDRPIIPWGWRIQISRPK